MIIAIVTSLIDEVIILAIILFGLPRLGIQIPLYGIVLIVLFFGAYAFIFFRLGSGTLRKKPLAGLTDMVGVEGRTASRLNPEGYVMIHGELWESRAHNGVLPKGTDVIVVDQYGLKLVVRPRQASDESEADRD